MPEQRVGGVGVGGGGGGGGSWVRRRCPVAFVTGASS